MRNTITLLTSEFPPGPGGIGNHAYNLAKWLSISNYSVEVITDSRKEFYGDISSFDENINFNVKRSKRHKGPYVGISSRLFLYFKAILNSSQNEIFIASGKFPIWVCGIFSKIFQHKKFIAIVHGSEVNPKGKLNRMYIKWCLNKMDLVIAVSNYTKSLINKLDNKTRVDVIPNGFDEVKFKENKIKKINSDQLLLITVGTLSSRKGQKNVIKVLPKIKKENPNLMYHIVGLPKEEKEILKLAKSLKVQEYIEIHGPLNDKKMIKLLNKSDIFMMLSQESKLGDVEGFGIAILEANNLGIPAIGSKKTGIEDAICDGFSGYLVDPNDKNQINFCINKILNDYEKFSKNSKAWAKNFHWSKIIRKYNKHLAF
jgi:phosphatidyl-myo-inositol dimannoside synthase